MIQPLDQGVIVAFKAHYHRHHIQFLIDQLKNGAAEKDVKVNMLQVLQWCRFAKRFVMGETLSKCWVKSSILPVLQENEVRGEGGQKRE